MKLNLEYEKLNIPRKLEVEMLNITHVIKRDKTIVPFNKNKITEAVMRSMDSTEGYETDRAAAEKVTNRVLNKMRKWEASTPNVDQIHILVEDSLMEAKLLDVAREYIGYRKDNKPDIFKKRVEIEPHEYPYLLDFTDAIYQSYWLHTHFNYDADVQDFKVNMTDSEKEVCKRAMLAISQIENAVKAFWARLDIKMPKPEVSEVGATFAESEVRHGRAYKELLKKLGLQDDFKELCKVPAIKKRVQYLEKVNANIRSVDNEDFFESIILFSMFVENVSLFSQFVVLMSFRKHRNILKGISNAVEATSKEEVIHAEFGFTLINIIKEENPDWFTEELVDYIKKISLEAFEAEKEIIEWIYEEGDLDFVRKSDVIEFTKDRINQSLKAIGVNKIFDVDESVIDSFEWFDDELRGTKRVDFFNTEDPQYSKGIQSFATTELF